MLRIAIVNVTGGGISEGYKKYLKNILPLMSRHHKIKAILCASPQNLAVPSWFKPMNNVTFVNCKPYKVFAKKDEDLHNQIEQFHPDVIFVPIERYFKHGDTPTVCMLQNMLPMAPLKHPNLLETIRNKVQKSIARKAVERSRRIVAISCYVSEFLQREWQIPSHKIGIVYHGVELPRDEELPVPAILSPEWANQFIFTAGSIEIFRGLEDIILAVDKLRQHGRDERVVIAGSARAATMSYYRKLQELVERLDLRRNIFWAGMLNEKEMAWCFRNARAYIMSSKVEACPNTALEAMSYGKIIISSTARPMYEFFRESAKYYETGDEKKLADCIIDVSRFSSAEKDGLAQAAMRRALEFSWEDTVDQTIAEFYKAVNNTN